MSKALLKKGCFLLSASVHNLSKNGQGAFAKKIKTGDSSLKSNNAHIGKAFDIQK